MTMKLPDAFVRTPITHRALHDVTDGRPENSRAAMRAAIEAGYGIELDLQPSREGVPMVFHDADLDRLTHENGPVSARPASELSQIPLKGSDETIPTLAGILDQVAGRVPLLIEMKDQTAALGPGPDTFEPDLARLLLAYKGPVAVMSFNPQMVEKMAQLAPDLPRGLTTCAFDAGKWGASSIQRIARLNRIEDAEYVGASFVSHDHRDLASPAIETQRAAGRAILCWTIRSPAEEAAARVYADQVTFEGYCAPIT